MQLTVIVSHDTEMNCDNCGRQYFALGGRGIAVTALPRFGTVTVPNIRMGFDIVFLNMMALLLSFYDTDRREDGINDS